MNLYFVVEGKTTEKKLYKRWIPYLCSSFTYVESIYDINHDNFSIISGNGYPQYFDTIKNAFRDISNKGYNIDILFICVDSENFDYDTKLNEIECYIRCECPTINSEVRIIVQNHCIETWLMGNKDIDISNSNNAELITYRNHYNVNINDPEGLTSIHGETIGKFTKRYLKLMLHENGMLYSRNNINYVGTRSYFRRLIER